VRHQDRNRKSSHQYLRTGFDLMNSLAPNAKSKMGEPWGPILARVSAAILGGYAFAYAAGLAAAKLLPLRPSEAVYLISMLQVALYVGVVIWVFSVTGKRAWLTLIILSGLCLAVAQFK
jgi:hypothetical protein